MVKALVLSFLVFCFTVSAISGGIERGQDQNFKKAYRPGVLVVKFKETSFKSVAFKLGSKNGVPVTNMSSLDNLNTQFGISKISQDELYQPTNVVVARQLGINRIYLFNLSPVADIEAIAKKYAEDSNVEFAEPDWQVYLEAVPNDPLHPNHWGHNNTAQMPSYNWSVNQHNGPNVGTVGFDANAQAAWDGTQGYGSSSVVIGIIDTGVDWAHPDLTIATKASDPIDGVDNDGNGKIDDFRGWDFGDNDNNPDDNSAAAGHGTACSGVAAAVANNGVGVAGIAGGCKIMPLKAANNAGSLFNTAITNAIYYGADNGCKVLSMSLGGTSSDAAQQTACTYAWNLNVVVLAATGNENKTTVSYPAANTNVIGVGAASPCGERKRSSSLSSELNPGVSADPNGYTCDGERWWGSNYGSTTKDAANAVDVIAPTILPTTDRHGSVGYDPGDYDMFFNGTSCATPYAAGVCALIFSKNPTWTSTQVRNQLCNTAQDVVSVESGASWDRYAGYGMVDAQAAVGATGTPSITVTSPNGAENWTVLTAHNVTWTWTTTIANVKIEYSTDGGSNYSVVTASVANTGTYSWTVPNTPTTTARVRVSDASNSATNDVSNANFTISAVASPTITVTAPNGGENWTVASSRSITWSYTGSIANVKIEYSTDGGTNYSVVTASVANSGTYSWTVPNTPSTTARVRVSDAANAATNDVSNANFIISSTPVVVTIFSETFETNTVPGTIWGAADNTATSGSDYWGDESTAQGGRVHGGSWGAYCADNSTVAGQKYDNYMDAYMAHTNGVNISGYSNVQVSFWLWYNTEATYDYVSFQYWNGTTWVEFTSGRFTGTGTAWAQKTFTVPGAAGTTFKFRWMFHSDLSVTSEGAYVDDITVTGNSPGASPKNIADEILSDIPTKFELYQNYPNPFNPTTNLKYDLPVAGQVTLKLYNILGAEVATLVDEIQEAGYKSVKFDAGNLPSGIYYYRISAGSYTAIKNMMLIK